jgi:hypothetical protein
LYCRRGSHRADVTMFALARRAGGS